MAKLDNYRLKLNGREYRPLMIGGMGVDISTSELALSACAEGAIGHISDAMAPYVSDRKFKTKFQNTKSEHFKASRDTLDKTGVKWDPEMVYEAGRRHAVATMEAKKGEGGVFINVIGKF